MVLLNFIRLEIQACQQVYRSYVVFKRWYLLEFRASDCDSLKSIWGLARCTNLRISNSDDPSECDCVEKNLFDDLCFKKRIAWSLGCPKQSQIWRWRHCRFALLLTLELLPDSEQKLARKVLQKQGVGVPVIPCPPRTSIIQKQRQSLYAVHTSPFLRGNFWLAICTPQQSN